MTRVGRPLELNAVSRNEIGLDPRRIEAVNQSRSSSIAASRFDIALQRTFGDRHPMIGTVGQHLVALQFSELFVGGEDNGSAGEMNFLG